MNVFTNFLISISYVFLRLYLDDFDLSILIILVLFLIGIIVYFGVLNKKKHQRIIKLEDDLRHQQFKTQLKQEELKTITTLLEVQEKERILIANELHDDLGSMMATIKIHFNKFKLKDPDNLFQKTNEIIDTAYQRIRHLSNDKNSGVLSKKGLVEALKKHSKSISKTSEIKINIIENGMNDRLKNMLELTIFRVIQELVSNVLKHAKANEINIHLSQHDNMLNIIVEDDGIGFDTKKPRIDNSGIGLISTERRIEKFGGTMMIESQPESGTTIIIDLPL